MNTVHRVLAVVSLLMGAAGPADAQTTPAPPAPPPSAVPAPAPPVRPAPADAAVPATLTAPPAPAASAAPAPPEVTGAAAWEKLKGNTITGRVAGDTFSEFFDPGGGVRYVDKDGLSTGTWAQQNAKVCFDFPDDDDRSCSTFMIQGSSGSAVDDDGMTTKFEIEPGNAKGL